MTDPRHRNRWMPLLVLLTVVGLPLGVNAGSPDPPVPAGEPTMRPLDQVDPRTAIVEGMLPLTISEAGSYYLAEDISTTGGGILVQADGVTIDMMGFTLGGGNGPGINATGYYRTTVKNGNVQGWSGSGVRLGIRAVVSDLIVMENDGSGIDVGADARIENCTVADNKAHGIITGLGSTVEGCVSDANDENGVWVIASFVSGCIINSNGKNGIRVDGNSTILDNHLFMNDWGGATRKAGIWVNGDSNRIERNMISENYFGIDLDGSYNVIARNFLANNIVSDLEIDPMATFNQVYLHGLQDPWPVPPWANLQHFAGDISP